MSVRRLIGREAELSALQSLIDHGGCAAVVGPPGIGKSALAQAWLEGRAGAGQATVIVGLAEATTADLDDRIASAAIPRGAALVLDDADRVSAAAGAAAARLAATGVQVVVTGRRAPGPAGVELGPLALDHAADRPSAAAAMFTALAGAAHGADPAAIEDLVARLEGVPLAIALAAARADVLPPADLAARLDEPFAVLRRPGEPRTHSLAGAIGWSWAALEPWVQRALAQLTVFATAFEVGAAEDIVAVGPDGSLLDALGVLRADALLQPEPGRPGVFRMLAMIRAFARLRGEPTMIANAVARHAAHFARLGRAQGDRYEATGDPGARAWLERALPELDLAAHHAVGAEAALAADLVRAQARPSPARIAHLDRAAAAASDDPVLLARVLDARAGAHLALGVFDRSVADRRRALTLIDDRDDALATRLHLGLGFAALAAGDLASGQAALTDAQAAAERAGDRTSLGRIGAARGLHAMLVDDHAAARAAYERALTVHREVGDRVGEASSAAALAALLHEAGDLAEAEPLYARALALLRALGAERQAIVCLANLALLDEERDRRDDALARMAEARAQAAASGNRRVEGVIAGHQGRTLLAAGELADAEAALADAAELLRDTLDPAAIAPCAAFHAAVLAARDQLALAAVELERAAAAAIASPRHAPLVAATRVLVELERARLRAEPMQGAAIARAALPELASRRPRRSCA